MTRAKAFTLIELLIVIAIIAILALIAVPNFLEAQVRAKVSRVQADLRTLATALEAYAVDWGAYPRLPYLTQVMGKNQDDRDGIHFATSLTTPVGYITSVDMADPFGRQGAKDEHGYFTAPPSWRAYSYNYINIAYYQSERTPPGVGLANWLLVSLAPDMVKGPDPTGIEDNWTWSRYARPVDHLTMATRGIWNYDSSNGTMSGGDILRWGD